MTKWVCTKFVRLKDYIKSDKYGNEIKATFYEIKKRVSKTYGKPKMFDKVHEETLLKKKTSMLAIDGN